MKLQCQIDVKNRTHCSLNLKTNSKYVKSTLALGKEPKRETEFFIIHFSSLSKSGTKYKVKNITNVFVSCINEGKCTIRLSEPPHDLCIKGESIQLKCFMTLLKSCMRGGKDVQLTSLTSLSATANPNIAPTKLVIRCRSEIPTKTSLPRTLQSLYMTGLKLCNFRREILLLKHLNILDLSHNEIEKLPAEFGRMPCLSEVHLQHNKLGDKREIDWSWLQGPQITKTLKLLDLTGNNIEHLPKSIWKLQNLVTLKLDHNQLKKLPAMIGRIKSLRYLTVSNNNLQSLPCSLSFCRLEHIDICKNNFSLPEQYTIQTLYVNNNIENLVNLAAKIVLKHKLFYAPNIIPRTLVDYLDNSSVCLCGNPTITDRAPVYRCFDMRDIFKVVMSDTIATIPFEIFYCSCKCKLDYINVISGKCVCLRDFTR